MTKIVLLGDGGVGKTSFLKSIRQGTFPDRYCGTVGAEVHPHLLGGRDVTIWDTAGRNELMGPQRETYLSDATICVIFFDLTHRKSYTSVQEHYNFAVKYVPDAHFIIVGNKSELPRVVTNTNFQYITTNNTSYHEVSIKTGEGMQDLLNAIQQAL